MDSDESDRTAPRVMTGRHLAIGATVAAASTAAGAAVASFASVDSPVAAVAGRVIDGVPKPVREWAIETFGTSDKLVLGAGIVVILGAVATLVASQARRRRWLIPASVAAFTAIGVAAEGDPSPGSVLAALASAIMAYLTFVLLARFADEPRLGGRRALGGRPGPPTEDEAAAGVVAEPMTIRRWDAAVDRRAFVGRTAGLWAATAAMGGVSAAVNRSDNSSIVAARTKLPAAPRSGPDAAASVPAGASAPGAVPFVTPNADFYRIDTAFVAPRVSLGDWRLTIDGAVDRPLTLTYDELLDRHVVERIVTLCCVSNFVGGDLIGTARFLGVPLGELLEEAGVRPKGTQVASRSSDGWTCSFPTELAMDGRDALVAVGMNGAPLPVEHGFPARLVVPGLYGYVSATKWLTHIELVDDDFEGYWIPRGWSKLGPVKTQSRIDVPASEATVTRGRVVVAGVAWAQHVGIDRVEIRVDDGQWVEARLADEVTIDTWRQWTWEWDASPGDHELAVRATDRDGDTQPATKTPVAPNGAEGHHTVVIHVE